MANFPANVRIALKDGDLHVLLPGELAGPFKRSGYEVQEYLPATDTSKEERYSQKSELEDARQRVDDALREETALFDSLGDPIEDFGDIVGVIFAALRASSKEVGGE